MVPDTGGANVPAARCRRPPGREGGLLHDVKDHFWHCETTTHKTILENAQAAIRLRGRVNRRGHSPPGEWNFRKAHAHLGGKPPNRIWKLFQK